MDGTVFIIDWKLTVSSWNAIVWDAEAMRKKIVLLGSKGQLGRALGSVIPSSNIVLMPSRQELNLTDLEAVQSYLELHKPDIIINAAGYTGVQNCEANKELANQLNTELPARLAQISTQLNALFVHFSCLSVHGEVLPQHGHALYTEASSTDPKTHYARSKLAGDWAVQAQAKSFLIFRLSGLYSSTDLSIKTERDALHLGAPTSADYVAATVVRSLERIYRKVIRFRPGVYNLSTKGHADWLDFYSELSNLRQSSQVLSTSPRLVEQGSRICVEKIESSFCILIPSWKAQLKSLVDIPQVDKTPHLETQG